MCRNMNQNGQINSLVEDKKSPKMIDEDTILICSNRWRCCMLNNENNNSKADSRHGAPD